MIEGSKDGYPELEEKKEFIFNVIAKEEANFNRRSIRDLRSLQIWKLRWRRRARSSLRRECIPLYDTYGFPIDLTSEILEEKGLTYDEEGFKKAQEEQRAKSEEHSELIPIQEKKYLSMMNWMQRSEQNL